MPLDETPPPILDYASRPPARWSEADRRAAVNGCLTSLAYVSLMLSITFLSVMGIHAAWAWWHASR